MTDSTAIVPLETKTPGQITHLEELNDQAREILQQSKAPNTRRAYRLDWQDFTAWCEEFGCRPLPAMPETVVRYLTDRASRCKVSTLQRRLTSISVVHEAAGYASPTKQKYVREFMEGIRRAKGTAPKAKAPAVVEVLRRLLSTPACNPDTLAGKRNRALLLLGFSGAFRRSELVSLDREDVTITLEGAIVNLRRSKTDQESQGREVGIPYGARKETCPVRALTVWLETAGIQTGPLFRQVNRHGTMLPERFGAQSVALVVKAAADAAGLDASSFSGHSLRAGLATSAAAAGAPERAIMAQTGHRSVAMVRRYVRHGSLFRENAATGLL